MSMAWNQQRKRSEQFVKQSPLLISFSSRFLPNFATTAEPLRKLTRQDTKWQQGREENEAFEALKNQLAEASMMALYDKNAPTEVITDATQSDLGQYPPVQEQRGVNREIAFASRGLSEVKTCYKQMEKEVLAVVWGCKRFNLYLSGLESFRLVTDCKVLGAIYGPKPSSRVERWVLRLMPFKNTVRHVPSGQNIADCLSRLIKISALSHFKSKAEEYVRMVAISATPRVMATREIERSSAEDEELTKVRKCRKTGYWYSAPSPYKLLRDEITVAGSLFMKGMRIVVPLSLRKRVLELAH